MHKDVNFLSTLFWRKPISAEAPIFKMIFLHVNISHTARGSKRKSTSQMVYIIRIVIQNLWLIQLTDWSRIISSVCYSLSFLVSSSSSLKLTWLFFSSLPELLWYQNWSSKIVYNKSVIQWQVWELWEAHLVLNFDSRSSGC